MARKPKAAPSNEPELPVEAAQPAPDDTAPAVRRGRKPRAAAPVPEPGPVGDDGAAETDTASPAILVADSAPARGRAARRPKGLEEAAASFLVREAMGQPEPEADQPGTAAEPAAAGDSATATEVAHPVSAGGNGDALAGGAASSRTQDAAPPAKPAAQWDRATDTVRFDWAAIERTASQDGPNQVMAKLLVAARAEGANSRWPL